MGYKHDYLGMYSVDLNPGVLHLLQKDTVAGIKIKDRPNIIMIVLVSEETNYRFKIGEFMQIRYSLVEPSMYILGSHIGVYNCIDLVEPKYPVLAYDPSIISTDHQIGE